MPRGWHIPDENGETQDVIVGLFRPYAVSLRQGEMSLELTVEQLHELSHKLVWLDELFHRRLDDAFEGLRPAE